MQKFLKQCLMLIPRRESRKEYIQALLEKCVKVPIIQKNFYLPRERLLGCMWCWKEIYGDVQEHLMECPAVDRPLSIEEWTSSQDCWEANYFMKNVEPLLHNLDCKWCGEKRTAFDCKHWEECREGREEDEKIFLEYKKERVLKKELGGLHSEHETNEWFSKLGEDA